MNRVSPPPSPLVCTATILEEGRTIHRIHQSRFHPTEFNPGLGGTRFAPIADADGGTVPTLYAATSFACAAFEYVFHDIDEKAAFKSVSMSRIADLRHSVLVVTDKVRLGRLFEPDLNKWGISRRELIDTPPGAYPLTRRWSAAAYRDNADIDGLIWTSRRYDEEQAMLFFGSRRAGRALSLHSTERIASSAQLLGELHRLGSRAGIVLTI